MRKISVLLVVLKIKTTNHEYLALSFKHPNQRLPFAPTCSIFNTSPYITPTLFPFNPPIFSFPFCFLSSLFTSLHLHLSLSHTTNTKLNHFLNFFFCFCHLSRQCRRQRRRERLTFTWPSSPNKPSDTKVCFIFLYFSLYIVDRVVSWCNILV